MDDRVPVLAAENYRHFKKLQTIPLFSVHLIISTCISTTGIILAATWPDSKRCDAYFIMLYLRAAFYVVTWILDWFWSREHFKLLLNGYHEFYRATKSHKSLPMQIVQLWNAALLAVSAGLQHYYGTGFTEKCMTDHFSPIIYVTAFSCVETIIFCFVHGSYISRVSIFNNLSLSPDALLTQGINAAIGSVGLMQRGADVTDLLEKQGNLIEFLHFKNQTLNQKIMQMSNQMRPHPII